MAKTRVWGGSEAGRVSSPPTAPALPHAQETTGDSVPASTAVPSRPRASWQTRVAGAVVAAGVGATGAYYVVTEGPAGTPLPAPAVTASAEVAPLPPVPVVTALPVLPRVRLAVAPHDAIVEVDDAGAPTHDGAVEISGALGSVHHVRVSRGPLEASAEVRVTERGAVPARVELGAPHAAVRGPSGPAVGTPTVAPVAPTKPLIPDRFE